MKKIIICGASSEQKEHLIAQAINQGIEAEFVQSNEFTGFEPISETIKQFELSQSLLYSDLSKKQLNANILPIRNSKENHKIQRNQKCICGSGLKFKKCCANKSEQVY